MASKLIAWGRKIGKKTKTVEIDRGHFSGDAHAKKVHLSDREMDRLVGHLCQSDDQSCQVCAEELDVLSNHIMICRFCRSKMQALLSLEDSNGPEDRRPNAIDEELENLHISTPPDRDFYGLKDLHLIDEPDVMFIAE